MTIALARAVPHQYADPVQDVIPWDAQPTRLEALLDSAPGAERGTAHFVTRRV